MAWAADTESGAAQVQPKGADRRWLKPTARFLCTRWQAQPHRHTGSFAGGRHRNPAATQYLPRLAPAPVRPCLALKFRIAQRNDLPNLPALLAQEKQVRAEGWRRGMAKWDWVFGGTVGGTFGGGEAKRWHSAG